MASYSKTQCHYCGDTKHRVYMDPSNKKCGRCGEQLVLEANAAHLIASPTKEVMHSAMDRQPARSRASNTARLRN